MAITQGSPLPDITQTTTRQDQAPDYYTNYLSGLSQAGQTAIGRTPTQSVAGYDPMQVMGYGKLPDAATSYQPQLQAAQSTAEQAAAGITPERVQAFMNPYTSNVVDEMGRLQQQNIQRNLMPQLKAGFVGTGSLGSSRYANAMGQTMSDLQSNLLGQQYGALSKGYSEALKGALDEGQLKNLAAGTQGKLAQQELDMGLTGAGALTKAGAERQAYEQSLLDAPLRTATTASGLMRGFTVPQTQKETFVGPKAGSYGTSDLSNVLGVLSVLGSAAGGKGLSTVANAGSGLLDLLKGTGSGTNLLGNFKIDPNEFLGTNSNNTPVYYDTGSGKYYGTDGKEVAIDWGEY